MSPAQEPVSFNLHHFAGEIPLFSKERAEERSGATVKELDAAEQRDLSGPKGLRLAAFCDVTPLDRCAASPCTLCLAKQHAKSKQNGAD